MEIEHHKWPSIKDWKPSWLRHSGFSILYWRSRVVFNPLSTSDDLINNIVVNSRNFNQACTKFSIPQRRQPLANTEQQKNSRKHIKSNLFWFLTHFKISSKNSWNHLSIINGYWTPLVTFNNHCCHFPKFLLVTDCSSKPIEKLAKRTFLS